MSQLQHKGDEDEDEDEDILHLHFMFHLLKPHWLTPHSNELFVV